MPTRFRAVQRGQILLMPPKLNDWVAEILTNPTVQESGSTSLDRFS